MDLTDPTFSTSSVALPAKVKELQDPYAGIQFPATEFARDAVLSCAAFPGIRNAPTSRGRFLFNKIRFCSRSEAACAILMERYIGYQTIPGQTFQIPLAVDRHGNLLAIDFLVRGCLFEYHPASKHNGRPQAALRKSQVIPAHQLANYDWRREDDDAALVTPKKALNKGPERFIAERRKLIDARPELSGKELIVATDPRDFYLKVIKRFSPIVPSEGKVLASFKEELERIPRAVI